MDTKLKEIIDSAGESETVAVPVALLKDVRSYMASRQAEIDAYQKQLVADLRHSLEHIPFDMLAD